MPSCMPRAYTLGGVTPALLPRILVAVAGRPDAIEPLAEVCFP